MFKNLDDCFTFLQPLLDDPDFDNDILINNIGISESLSSLIKYKNIGTVTEKGMLSDDTNISQSIVNDGELGFEDESISCISTVHDTSIEHMVCAHKLKYSFVLFLNILFRFFLSEARFRFRQTKSRL